MLSYTDRPMLYDGVPTFLGVSPVTSRQDLQKADVAIIGVPYLTPLFGFDADLTPRKIRQASTKYSGGYLPELDIDVLGTLNVVDYGDARIEPDNLPLSVANVTAKVREVLDAGALPITLGGSAPCSGYTCAAALSAFHQGKPIGAINLDAHGDNRESWEGSSELSAVTWVRHQLSLPGFAPQHHMQVGMRGPGNPKANADWFRTEGCSLYTAREIRRLGGDGLVQEVVRQGRGWNHRTLAWHRLGCLGHQCQPGLELSGAARAVGRNRAPSGVSGWAQRLSGFCRPCQARPIPCLSTGS